ncbi:putative metallo-beta-lactamase [Sphingopyxis fribergensis]|uniref:Putative metallo-beta-lactamase n=1 Tax=Sphingopyxis fribergensis TaxID=1515612 RepID=A0A0A7PN34_9SPHN|nr:subclass B3 metallo-beta-lactamase [Sphingopyxis fribergensis]AJA09312.1 putative metallo-beta-lactamase [Sphingopyxis fribergensis]
MIATITIAAWLAGVSGVSVPAADDPLTRPLAVERAKEWLAPLPPEKIFGNSYLVGFGGLSVALIDTGDGLVLIDGALPQAAPAILANVRKLGFDPKDIKFILSTEPHFDHAGGLAALARDTGATVVASARGAEGLRTGMHAKDDPQLAYGGSWPAVTRLRVVKDGEVLKLGKAAITAVATPGHTMGSMSWRWQACEGEVCKAIVFASSLNPVSADGYRFSSKAGASFVKGFAESYRKMEAMPCDVLIAAHPDNAGPGRYDETPGACSAYADRGRKKLEKRLADERSGTK